MSTYFPSPSRWAGNPFCTGLFIRVRPLNIEIPLCLILLSSLFPSHILCLTHLSLSLSLSLSLTHSFPLQYIYPKAPLLNMLMPEKCTAIFYFLIRSPTITGVYMRDVAHLAFTLAGLAFFALSIICLDNFQCYWSRCTSHLDIQYMFRCVCGASGKKRKGDIGFKSVRMLGAPNRIFIYIAEEERKREKEKTWSWVTDVLLFIHLQADAVSDTST